MRIFCQNCGGNLSLGINIKQEFFDDYFKTRKSEYYWVPVWFAKIKYNDEDYIVMMNNGKTGETSGECFVDRVTISHEKITDDEKKDNKRRNKSILEIVLFIEMMFFIFVIF